MKKQTTIPENRYLRRKARRIGRIGLFSIAVTMGTCYLPVRAEVDHFNGSSFMVSAKRSIVDKNLYNVDVPIKGTVKDENGESIPGVNVLLKGTSAGTTTDANGGYTINVPDNASGILVFSYIGYVTEEVPINGRSTIDVSLVPDIQSLSEVVVIGYGTAKKSDLTGSVTSVKEMELKERPAPSLNQALAGRMPGVQVNSNSGRPGGRANVRIRGFSSINSSNNPLYVVDGVQLPMGNQAQASQAIDYINPNDIVSVEVLKDASSTAIYGARGANGVILITTKRGKSGDGQVTYDVDFSVPTVGPNFAKVLNAREFLAVEDLAYQNMEKYDPENWALGRYTSRNPALARTDPRLFDANGNPLYDTNWLKEATQNKLSQNHQLGFTGGNERTTYALTLNYRDDQGLLKTSYLKRYAGRFTVDNQIKNWLKIGGTLNYNYQTENIVDHTDQVPRSIVEDFPFMPVRYPDGTYADNRHYPNAEGRFNAVHRLEGTRFILNTQTLLGSIYSNIKFTEDLEMQTVLGANMITQENQESVTRTLNIGQQGNAAARNRRESFWSLENYLTYTKRFGNVHSLKALLGISWQKTDLYSMGATIQNFSTDYFLYNNLAAGSTNPQVSSFAVDNTFNSYFTRINYGLFDKYLVTFTARADGSSKFGENKKYAIFPSAALAWRVSEEPFLQNSNVISNLKLRTSYGLSGNSEIPSYQSQESLSSGYAAVINDTRVGGTGLGRLGNPNLRWEKTAQYDAGLELGLFKGRVNLEADIYYRKTTDMLLDAPVPRTSGFTTIRKNIGAMENKGLDLALNTVNVEAGDFSWNSTLNVSMNRNKILALATPAPIFGVGGPNFTNPTNVIQIGEPAGSFWGLVRLGTWSEAERAEAAEFVSYRAGRTLLPGDIKYLDVNGDKAITDADRMIIGNGYPKAWGAFINTFRYKNFDLTVELQYSYGNDILDMTLHSSEDRQALANSYATVLNAWRPDNQNTMIAEIRDTRAGYVTNVDTHWIKDGSFIRGRNILLAYNFPEGIYSKMKLNRLRVYGSVQNAFLIVDKEVNGDPEATPTGGYANDGNNVFSQGMNWHTYPRPTTFMVGLNIGI